MAIGDGESSAAAGLAAAAILLHAAARAPVPDCCDGLLFIATTVPCRQGDAATDQCDSDSGDDRVSVRELLKAGASGEGDQKGNREDCSFHVTSNVGVSKLRRCRPARKSMQQKV
jgi:hypothetical protein